MGYFYYKLPPKFSEWNVRTIAVLDLYNVDEKYLSNIFHEGIKNMLLRERLRSYEKNKLKKIQKMPKGFFRDQGILHHLLKINSLDNLLIHPVAGFSFESFVVEEIIRGFQCTLTAGIDFHFYRTRDKSEIDLIIDAPFGVIPIEIKLGYKIKKGMLTALKNFLKDTNAHLGILVNNSDKIEFLANNIMQIPVHYF